MSLFNFSSTDPAHYNRIRVNLPNHFLSSYVKLCATAFTANCNIEVMNTDDYIEFGTYIGKINMENSSKVSAASICQILQDIFDKKTERLTVRLTNTDTLEFVSPYPFTLNGMSYNMKLLTGFYCKEDKDFPISAVEFEEDELVDPENEDPIEIYSIEFKDLELRVKDLRPIKKTTNPENASGYTITYSMPDNDIISIDDYGYVSGLKAGEVKVQAEVRNFNSSQFVKPDFTCEIKVNVYDPESSKITHIETPTEIVIRKGDVFTVYPEVHPAKAIYEEKWESDDNYIATVKMGYITGVAVGETKIFYRVNNVAPYTQKFENVIKLIVKSEYEPVKKYRITADSVGYMLSTPILYLLTNIGSNIFFNEIHDQRKLQCGTVCMCLNNSYSQGFPIIAQQADIITKCAVNATSDIYFILVDANMHEVKLLNPMYITVQILPDDDQNSLTPGVGMAGVST